MSEQLSGDPVYSSILTSTKHSLGILENYEHFDPDIIMFINSSISTLTQLGVGPSNGFSINGAEQTWNDFLGTDQKLNFVKTYIYLKVRMLFDPPENGATMTAMIDTVSELEWRINTSVELSV